MTENRRKLLPDLLDDLQPVFPAIEGKMGFIPDDLRLKIRLHLDPADIGRIGNDQRKPISPKHRADQVRLHEIDQGLDPMPSGILPGHQQSLPGNIGCQHLFSQFQS